MENKLYYEKNKGLKEMFWISWKAILLGLIFTLLSLICAIIFFIYNSTMFGYTNELTAWILGAFWVFFSISLSRRK